MQTDVGRRCRRRRANSRFGRAALGNTRRRYGLCSLRSRVVIHGDTMSCGGPFFSGSFPSRQWHDWQSYEGPVSRSLVPTPPATLAPPGSRIRRGVSRPSTFLASPFGSEGGVEGRGG